METKLFKYQKQIDILTSLGCQLPELFAPNNIFAYRFTFSDTSKQNHVPQYMANPKRMLQDISKKTMTTSLLALSCFDNELHAVSFYSNLRKSFKNISSTIGNILSGGVLSNDMGTKTATSTNGHFDFYEFDGCDLTRNFQTIKYL